MINQGFFKVAFLFALVSMFAGCIVHQAQVVDIQTAVRAEERQIPKRDTIIQVHYPPAALTTTKEEIGIVAAVNAGEIITSVIVSVNDKQVKRFDVSSQGAERIPIEVVIPLILGENQITVTADMPSGKRVSKTVALRRIKPVETLSSEVIGKRWAVVIGISKYQHSGKGIPPLKFALNDATTFMDFLHSSQGGGFNPARTKLLTDEQATTRNIRSALYTFLKQAGKDDLVIIYFAGHGAPEPGCPDNLYLISYDTDPKDMASTAFPMWDMETALKRYIVAERVVILADACHSGGVGGEAGLRSVGSNNMINTYLANLQKTKPGRAIITASEANQLSREGDQWGGHGVFTYFLLKGLKGEADADGNGVVTISEAFSYVYNKVRRATNSQQHPNVQGKFDRNLPLAVIK